MGVVDGSLHKILDAFVCKVCEREQVMERKWRLSGQSWKVLLSGGYAEWMWRSEFSITECNAGPENIFSIQLSHASRLKMQFPNKSFYLPNKFSPDPKLLFIFKSAIFHMPTYKHVFAKISMTDKCLIRKAYSMKPIAALLRYL